MEDEHRNRTTGGGASSFGVRQRQDPPRGRSVCGRNGQGSGPLQLLGPEPKETPDALLLLPGLQDIMRYGESEKDRQSRLKLV